MKVLVVLITGCLTNFSVSNSKFKSYALNCENEKSSMTVSCAEMRDGLWMVAVNVEMKDTSSETIGFSVVSYEKKKSIYCYFGSKDVGRKLVTLGSSNERGQSKKILITGTQTRENLVYSIEYKKGKERKNSQFISLQYKESSCKANVLKKKVQGIEFVDFVSLI